MLSSRTCTGWEPLRAVAGDWNRILGSCSEGVRGPDATCSPVWAEALAKTLLRDSEIRTLIVSRGTENVALVPTYLQLVRAVPFDKRELRVITEAHPGRTSLLAADNDADVVEFALDRLRTEYSPWDVFLLGVVENSASHAAVTHAARRLSLRTRCVGVNESPYVELGSGWESLLANLPKKMRWTIRKGEKELASMGRLVYEEMTTPAAVQPLLDCMFAIERKSWKEQSGTSITVQGRQQAFFEAFIRLAAGSGLLSAHILRLDERPIAYILGVAAGDSVFLDLKESFDLDYADYSPGHVLKRFAIEKLISRGVELYDFMGRCEPYKMRWTDRTYRRLTLAIFNRTVRGSLCSLRASILPRAIVSTAVKQSR